MSKNEWDKAFNIADLSKRHRFFNALPLGGRLIATRWLFEAPAELLDKEALGQRQNLLVAYPEYPKLAIKPRSSKSKLPRCH